MQQVIEVGTADFAVAGSGYVLRSQGIGSCVVVCLYDAGRVIGALCHIMLPHQEDDALNPLRFADAAIPMALEKMVQLGAVQSEIVGHLVGGASMFQDLGVFVNHIGDQNVAAAQAVLMERTIPIHSMTTGGTKGRSVTFTLDSGDVNVISVVK